MTRHRLAVAWTAVVVALCSVPGSRVPDLELRLFAPDKVVHVGLFLVFGWLWLRAGARVRAVALGGVAFAFGLEVWQAVLPIGRFADPYDVVADLVGLAGGVALGLWRRTAATT